jgi:hypothetical protein
MKTELLVLLAGIVLAPLPHTVMAQTLTNPGGLRGVPTVPGPVGGVVSPIGAGPKLEPMKIDLGPTLHVVPTPTVNQPNGLQNPQSDVPKRPVPPSPPPASGPDGDAETPDASGTPTIALSGPLGAGQGGQESSPSPTSSSQPASGSSRWLLIGVGLLAILLFGAKRSGRG